MTQMTNVISIREPGRDLRHARAAFIRGLLEADGRSARYVAGRLGISNSSMSDRLKGKVAFLAEDIEGIAAVLKMDAVELYRDFISVGPEGLEPPASTVKSHRFGEVLEFRGREAHAL